MLLIALERSCKTNFFRLLRPDGGIGRRAGLKHLWETVPVRLRLRVQKLFLAEELFIFMFLMIKILLGVRPQGSTPAPGT
jgi:hypothetical protein